MNTANHLAPEDLALFSLGFLPDEELKDAIGHMEHCESCRNSVAEYQGDLVAYAIGAAEMHTPPAAARERLLRKVAKEKKPVPIDRDQQHVEPVLASRNNSLLFPVESIEDRRPRRGLGFLAAAGWIFALGTSVFAGLQFHQRQRVQFALNEQAARITQATADASRATDAMQTLTDSGALQVALQIPAAADAAIPPKPDGHAAYMPEKGALVFIANHLPTLPPYKTYELWVIPPPGTHDPVPAGTFKPDATGSASVVMPDIPRNLTAAAFGVTIEDDGGSKSPTMPLVLLGKI